MIDHPLSPPPPAPFTPTPLRPRHDGWTTARQIAFVEALADCGCVEEACTRVGMSRASAYALRRHAASGSFREAWDAAIDSALHLLEDAAVGRAIHGVSRPIFYKGEQVGEWRHHDERLAMFLLRYRRQQRFGPWIDQVGAPDPDDCLDPAGRLDWHLGEIVEHAPGEDQDQDQDGSQQGGAPEVDSEPADLPAR